MYIVFRTYLLPLTPAQWHLEGGTLSDPPTHNKSCPLPLNPKQWQVEGENLSPLGNVSPIYVYCILYISPPSHPCIMAFRGGDPK